MFDQCTTNGARQRRFCHCLVETMSECSSIRIRGGNSLQRYRSICKFHRNMVSVIIYEASQFIKFCSIAFLMRRTVLTVDLFISYLQSCTFLLYICPLLPDYIYFCNSRSPSLSVSLYYLSPPGVSSVSFALPRIAPWTGNSSTKLSILLLPI